MQCMRKRSFRRFFLSGWIIAEGVSLSSFYILYAFVFFLGGTSRVELVVVEEGLG